LDAATLRKFNLIAAMGLQLPVKISGVNNLSDARYCAGMGVQWVGFCLDESAAAYLPAAKVTEIAGWLAGVAFIGELGSNDIPTDITAYPLNYLQTDAPEKLAQLSNYQLPLILRLTADTVEELPNAASAMATYRTSVDFFLLEGNLNPDALEVQTALRNICEKYRVVLGLPFRAEVVSEQLAVIQPYGIALEGGFEIKPGLKDFDEIAAILEALEVEDNISY
jgi:phosphoribosylanthranilate isomerase